MGHHVPRESRRGCGLHQQIPELGSRRSGKVGPRRLRVRARGFAGRRPLAGLPRPQRRAREQGFPRLYRMDRHAVVVQRQGRLERHFILRVEPVARRRAQSAAPGGDLRVGRLGRLLPRLRASRRHCLRVPQELAGDAGENGAARTRRTRAQEPRDRRTRMRAGDGERGRTREEPRRHVGGRA